MDTENHITLNKLSSIDWFRVFEITVALVTAYFTFVAIPQEGLPNLKSVAVMDSKADNSGVKLVNSGAGLIQIKDIQYIINDHKIKPITSYNLKKVANLSSDSFDFSALQVGDAILEGKEHWLIKTKVNSPEASIEIRNFLQKNTIKITYCSVDNECSTKTVGLKPS